MTTVSLEVAMVLSSIAVSVYNNAQAKPNEIVTFWCCTVGLAALLIQQVRYRWIE